MSIFLDHNFFIKVFETKNKFKLTLEKDGERIEIPQCGKSVNCEKINLEETIQFIETQLFKRGFIS